MSTILDRVREEHLTTWADAAGDAADSETGAATLRERLRCLLPVEAAAAGALTAEIRRLEREAEAAAFHAEHSLPRLSLEPLGWTQHRRVRGWSKADVTVPTLALLPLTDEQVSFSTGSDEYGRTAREFSDHYPQPVRDAYQPLIDVLRADAAAMKVRGATITWKFHGIIPNDARAAIATEVELRRFECVYLLAETTPEDWTITWGSRLPAPRLLDPLIVGWARNALWLITEFDPTPLEHYLSLEWTDTPALAAGTAERT